ncbi:MAG: hypothetical protein IPN88_08610 [Bacteroidetes bacterium]|nr:hypothetical protein [Bacteroidota bacterium]
MTSSSIEGNQWNKNDVAIVDDTLSTFNATESGSYSVTVTNSFGCSKTSQPEIIDDSNTRILLSALVLIDACMECA